MVAFLHKGKCTYVPFSFIHLLLEKFTQDIWYTFPNFSFLAESQFFCFWLQTPWHHLYALLHKLCLYFPNNMTFPLIFDFVICLIWHFLWLTHFLQLTHFLLLAIHSETALKKAIFISQMDYKSCLSVILISPFYQSYSLHQIIS